MIDVLDGVRDHYRATGLTERLKTALAALGPADKQLTPQQLAALDQFHTRGLAATAELGKLAGVTAGTLVLDVGSGVGGPARFLAATCGCQVTGVDLSEPFVDAARYLTERTGQSGQVSFETASALELPFDDGRFDVVLLQHVAMNISDRTRLYREIRRVLKSGGRFAIFDVVLNERRAALSRPLGANAGDELSLNSRRNTRGDRAGGGVPHIGRLLRQRLLDQLHQHLSQILALEQLEKGRRRILDAMLDGFLPRHFAFAYPPGHVFAGQRIRRSSRNGRLRSGLSLRSSSSNSPASCDVLEFQARPSRLDQAESRLPGTPCSRSFVAPEIRRHFTVRCPARGVRPPG